MAATDAGTGSVSGGLVDYAADLLVQSTVLLVVVWALQLLLRHHSPVFRRWLWLLALFACPFLPLIASGTRSSLPVVELELPILEVPAATHGKWVEGEPLPVADWLKTIPDTDAHPEFWRRLTKGGEANFSTAPPAPDDFPEATVRPLSWEIKQPQPNSFTRGVAIILAVGYVTCLGVLLMMVLAGILRMLRWLKRCEPVVDEAALATFHSAAREAGCEDPFFLVEGVPTTSPLTMGYLHPKILIPKGFGDSLDSEELRDLAKHELTHVRNRDPLSFVALAIVRALVFFNPLVWLGIRNVKLLAEQSADWSVAQVKERVLPYTRLLMRMAEAAPIRRSPAESVAGFLFGKGVLLKRSEALLSRRGGYAPVGRCRGALVAAAVAVSLLVALVLDVVPPRALAEPAAERRTAAVARVALGGVWQPRDDLRWILRVTMDDGTDRLVEFDDYPNSLRRGHWLVDSRYPGDPEARYLGHGSESERQLEAALAEWFANRFPGRPYDELVLTPWDDLGKAERIGWWVASLLQKVGVE